MIRVCKFMIPFSAGQHDISAVWSGMGDMDFLKL